MTDGVLLKEVERVCCVYVSVLSVLKKYFTKPVLSVSKGNMFVLVYVRVIVDGPFDCVV